jgi:anti-sigma B factor antagonist
MPLITTPVAPHAGAARGPVVGDAVRIVERLPLARSHYGELAETSMARLDVSCRSDQGYFVSTLRGALDAAAAPALREYLLRLVHESAGRLVIDLSSVTGADASGLSVLVGTGRRASLLGGLLRLAAPVAEVASALRTTGLDRQLRVYPSVEAAISGTVPA